MNVMNLLKEHRYEFVCVVLALLLLLALWPALKLGSEAEAKARQARDLDNRIGRLGGRGPDGVANPAMVQARKQLAEQTKLEAQEVAQLFRQRNERKFLISGLFPKLEAAAHWSFRHGYNQAIKDLYEQTLNAGWPQEHSTSSETKSPADIGIYVEDLEDLGIPEWVEAPGAPSSEECWFGQVAFWIQQDLVQLFSDLNLASAKRMGQQPSVANATVKRIVYIEIDEFYYIADLEQQLPSEIPGFGPGLRDLTGLQSRGGAPMPGWDPFGGMYPALQPRRRRRPRGQITPFTEHSSNDDADVLHFSFSVIIDSRYINEFLDLFSRKNLYTILNVSLSREDVEISGRDFKKFDGSDNFNPGKDAAEDLVYGTDPIVRLDIDAELLLLRGVYTEDMPEQVKKTVEEQIAQAAGQPLKEKSPARSRKRSKPKKTSRRRKKN